MFNKLDLKLYTERVCEFYFTLKGVPEQLQKRPSTLIRSEYVKTSFYFIQTRNYGAKFLLLNGLRLHKVILSGSQ